MPAPGCSVLAEWLKLVLKLRTQDAVSKMDACRSWQGATKACVPLQVCFEQHGHMAPKAGLQMPCTLKTERRAHPGQ